jgi:hypothetical protein
MWDAFRYFAAIYLVIITVQLAWDYILRFPIVILCYFFKKSIVSKVVICISVLFAYYTISLLLHYINQLWTKDCPALIGKVECISFISVCIWVVGNVGGKMTQLRNESKVMAESLTMIDGYQEFQESKFKSAIIRWHIAGHIIGLFVVLLSFKFLWISENSFGHIIYEFYKKLLDFPYFSLIIAIVGLFIAVPIVVQSLIYSTLFVAFCFYEVCKLFGSKE